jgi:hypothetical protein
VARVARVRWAVLEPAGRLAAAGFLALALGVLVYLADRDPAHAALIPAIPRLGSLQLFGTVGGWLPSLLHPFAFALLTAALQPSGASPAYWACALWWAIGVAFEAAQAPAIGSALRPMLDLLPLPSEWIAAVGRYMSLGTFDAADVIATTAGACAAAAALRSIHARGVKP